MAGFVLLSVWDCKCCGCECARGRVSHTVLVLYSYCQISRGSQMLYTGHLCTVL
jgi:hypothetical protein